MPVVATKPRRRAAPKPVEDNGTKLAAKISPFALARARATGGRSREPVYTPFDIRQPPPPGVPKDTRALAQDTALTNASAWANQGYYASSYQEGVSFLGYAELAVLALRAEYRVMSETIATEATREWIELTTNDEDKTSDKLKRIEDELDRMKVRDAFGKIAEIDGFFGRAHLYLDTGSGDDAEELATDLGTGRGTRSKLKATGRYKLARVQPVEPMWVYPLRYGSTDPLAEDWYRPQTWTVFGKQVHESRILRFVAREVPDLLKPAFVFGGLALSQMAMPYVNNWLRTRQSIADLLHQFSVMVLSTNLAASLQTGSEEMFARAEIFNLLRDNRGLMMVDRETEAFANVSAPLGGLEGLQAQSQQHMATVARIPIVKFFGLQPTGLNADSDGVIRTFYDSIHAYQEAFFRPNLTKVIDFVQLALFGEVDQSIGFRFKALWQLDEAGKASVQKVKADTDDAFIAMGAITPAVVAQRLINDPESPYAGIKIDVPEELPEASEMGLVEGKEEEGAAPGKPRDPGNRFASGVTNRAANLGEAGGQGFKGDGDRLAKSEVGFEHPACGPHHCSECAHFEPPDACMLVAGLIDEGDWCELFDARSNHRAS